MSQFLTRKIILEFLKFSSEYQKQLCFIDKKKKNRIMQWRIVTENFSHVANDYLAFCHTHDFG